MPKELTVNQFSPEGLEVIGRIHNGREIESALQDRLTGDDLEGIGVLLHSGTLRPKPIAPPPYTGFTPPMGMGLPEGTPIKSGHQMLREWQASQGVAPDQAALQVASNAGLAASPGMAGQIMSDLAIDQARRAVTPQQIEGLRADVKAHPELYHEDAKHQPFMSDDAAAPRRDRPPRDERTRSGRPAAGAQRRGGVRPCV
jgi:hypothetical protein